MYIQINTKELQQVVHIISRFSERKLTTLPVLSCIIFIAEKNNITLQATNLEVGAELTLDGVVKTNGTVAVPAIILKETISTLSSSGTVTLECTNQTLKIISENGTSAIKTLSPEDFPNPPSPEEKKTNTTVSGVVLKNLITSVMSYASTSTVRPELSSVLLKAQGGTITAVATDSFRLAEKKVSVTNQVHPFSILIPAKNLQSIIDTIPDTDVQIIADDHQCSLVWEGGRVTTRLVAAEYPDYIQIIPKTFVVNATVLKRDFESSLKRTAVFSDTFQKVRLGFSGKKKDLSLSSRNTDVGETEEHLTASIDGEDIELSFNYRYLQAPLSSFPHESITLSSSGIGRPLVIKSVGDNSFLYLVMPMNQ